MPPVDDLERLEKLFNESTAGDAPWFEDHGKIGQGDEGIGEMDDWADARLLVEAVNALPSLLAELHAARKALGEARDVAVTIEALPNVTRSDEWGDLISREAVMRRLARLCAALDEYAKVREGGQG